MGSFSMGAALLLLGVFLLLSQVFKWTDPAVALFSWWPIIFIILGVEIIVYQAGSKQEKTTIQYDFISIIFIAVLGTCGLVMAMLSASGLLELAGNVVKAEVRTADLPAYEETSLSGVDRIVVDAGTFPLTVESTEAKAVSLFGTYQAETIGDKSLIENASDYVMAEKKGDTLFIKLKELPHQRFINNYNDADATLLIPADKKLEFKGYDRNLVFKPRGLKSDWAVDTSGWVKIESDEKSDMKIEANSVYELEGAWKGIKDVNEEGLKSGYINFEKGTATLTVSHANMVEVD
ncbi:putative lipoprotein [Bacillus freudenreichii]|nr:putative lipoprotein [Bacillus freudenreichii]